MKLYDDTQTQYTTIMCEINAGSSKQSVFLLAGILLLWTIIALILSFTYTSLLIILLGWTMIFAITGVGRILNKAKLENFLEFVIKSVKR